MDIIIGGAGSEEGKPGASSVVGDRPGRGTKGQGVEWCAGGGVEQCDPGRKGGSAQVVEELTTQKTCPQRKSRMKGHRQRTRGDKGWLVEG